jgi:hypothetical protein
MIKKKEEKVVLPELSSAMINDLSVPGQEPSRGLVGRASDAFRGFFADLDGADGFKIHQKTELSDEELREINKLYLLGKVFHIKYMDEFLNGFMRLRVSKDRKGRSEFLQALVSAAQLDLAETKVENQLETQQGRSGFSLIRKP